MMAVERFLYLMMLEEESKILGKPMPEREAEELAALNAWSAAQIADDDGSDEPRFYE